MIALLIVIATVIGFVIYVKKKGPEIIREKARNYLIEADELVREKRFIVVVGIKYRAENARTALKEAKDGDSVDLIPEPDNNVDSNAVKVCFRGVHIGYIPRYLSKEIAESINNINSAVITSVVAFIDIPQLNIEVDYYKRKGLSDEAVQFLEENYRFLKEE